jgi:hypothetical protein
MNQPGPNFPYKCATCLDTGCDFCNGEPWPKETWANMTDQDIEQLLLDAIGELQNRAKVTQKLERLWSL